MVKFDAWREANEEGSLFKKILNECSLLKEKDTNELSRNALLLWGITQCGGSSEVKAKQFYEIL